MAGYVVCPYTPAEWRDILNAAQKQIVEMQLAISRVRRIERYAAQTPPKPGYDIFPIDADANAAMQALMNTKWGNILEAVGTAASLSLFRYKYVIAAGKPAAYLTATIDDLNATESRIVVNAGEPFTKVYAHITQGDRLTVGWTNSAGTARQVTGIFAESIISSNTLKLSALVNPQIIANGTFDSDTKWTYTANVSITGGKAVMAAANVGEFIGQDAADFTGGGFQVAPIYEVKYTISDYSSGSVQFILAFSGASPIAGATRGANGIHTAFITVPAGATATGFGIFVVTTATLKLDAVSVREIMPAADPTVVVTLEATYAA